MPSWCHCWRANARQGWAIESRANGVVMDVIDGRTLAMQSWKRVYGFIGGCATNAPVIRFIGQQPSGNVPREAMPVQHGLPWFWLPKRLSRFGHTARLILAQMASFTTPTAPSTATAATAFVPILVVMLLATPLLLTLFVTFGEQF